MLYPLIRSDNTCTRKYGSHIHGHHAPWHLDMDMVDEKRKRKLKTSGGRALELQRPARNQPRSAQRPQTCALMRAPVALAVSPVHLCARRASPPCARSLAVVDHPLAAARASARPSLPLLLTRDEVRPRAAHAEARLLASNLVAGSGKGGGGRELKAKESDERIRKARGLLA